MEGKVGGLPRGDEEVGGFLAHAIHPQSVITDGESELLDSHVHGFIWLLGQFEVLGQLGTAAEGPRERRNLVSTHRELGGDPILDLPRGDHVTTGKLPSHYTTHDPIHEIVIETHVLLLIGNVIYLQQHQFTVFVSVIEGITVTLQMSNGEHRLFVYGVDVFDWKP